MMKVGSTQYAYVHVHVTTVYIYMYTHTHVDIWIGAPSSSHLWNRLRFGRAGLSSGRASVLIQVSRVSIYPQTPKVFLFMVHILEFYKVIPTRNCG